MREIVFDTETTGLSPDKGDKIVEIGAVELINHMPTGRTYQQYINPEREMGESVIKVHGITNEFLKDKPTFKEIANDFLDFIGTDSKLVAHNAQFDINFLNYELKSIGYEELSYNRVIDTFLIARQKFPGSGVSLDKLCKRFNIDNSARTVHGALLDSELLSEVYLELLGGREPGLLEQNKPNASFYENQVDKNNELSALNIKAIQKEYHAPRIFSVSEEEINQHTEFVKKIKGNLWGVPND